MTEAWKLLFTLVSCDLPHLSSRDLLHSEGVVQKRTGREVVLGKFFDDHNSHVWVIQLRQEERDRKGYKLVIER